MRFIRDIINEKRSHSSPEAPEEDHDRFAAEPALENEPADWAMEGDPQAEPRQSLDQGQIDESVLRNIFARQDAVEDAVEDDLSQPQDTAVSEEVEPKLDTARYEDMQVTERRLCPRSRPTRGARLVQSASAISSPRR